MSGLLFKSFELTRGKLINNVEGFDEAILDVQPQGFNNTLHWHIGHVLTVAEQFMFGFPKKSTNLPANYMELFASGTKPADWQGDVPSVQELTAQLKEQLKRIKEIPGERFNEKLKAPFLGQETFGELGNFAVFHESNHLGQMHAMKRVIEAAK
ncbi:DinB family protein [Neobacillus sp. MM2021_6]|uniref:DinB family protein n=1 Tax=Bacillaceae TaxID=186817 RepID=UPI00140C5DE7|nr:MULTISPECIES: DinB family protein [Bacillaceae]MBO0960470.1 DinB family protein [Neobacillus sp. MM2021_6]NHC19629.1 DinB family protein [Bacillus sp. MM2020_4]WML42110.1 DinB family protein [Neobacillus sp. OS1-2]